MARPASTNLAAFFDDLRATGTNLPFPNSQLCSLLRFALVEADVTEMLDADADDYIPQILVAEEMRDQLAADLEVIEEELRFREEYPNVHD